MTIDSLADVRTLRLAIARGERQLFDLLGRHHWRLAFEALAYVAHWVTPTIEPRRFDTRFFLAAVPPGQQPAHDARETTEHVWLRPTEATGLSLDGTIALPPPTFTTMRWLERFTNVASALSWAREKPVPRIEPRVIDRGDTQLVTLPGDETMPAVAGFDAKETRFLLTKGRWIPRPADETDSG